MTRIPTDDRNTIADHRCHAARGIFVVVVLALSAACGVPPTAPSTPSLAPAAGVPARLELAADPGIAARGGTVDLTARVLDGASATLAGVVVTFGASAGTIDPAAAVTDADGVAHARLTAPAGLVQLTADAGALHRALATAVQPVVTPHPPTTTPPTLPDVPVPVYLAGGASTTYSGSARCPIAICPYAGVAYFPRAFPVHLGVQVTANAGDGSGPRAADALVRRLTLDFGDGTSATTTDLAVRSVEHRYAATGVITVAARAELVDGRTVSTSLLQFVIVDGWP